MKRKILACMLFSCAAGLSQQTPADTLTVCSVVQRLSTLANTVVAIRGRVTEKAEQGRPGSFYVDEMTEECGSGRAARPNTVRIALFEWPGHGRPLPKGYAYDASSISSTGRVLEAHRHPPNGGTAIVTVIGVLLVGQDHAARWIRQSGRSDVFINRPYTAELLYFAMRNPKPN